jgi:hypothetical protein
MTASGAGGAVAPAAGVAAGIRIGVTAVGHWKTFGRSSTERSWVGSTGEGPVDNGTGTPGRAVVVDALAFPLGAVVVVGLGAAVTAVDVGGVVAAG